MMKRYDGEIFVVNVPPLYIKDGVAVIVNNQIKFVDCVTGEGNSHLGWSYKMQRDPELYNYNDIRMFVVQPVFEIGSDLDVWFEENIIHISQDTRTNYGYKVDDRYEYASKTSLCVYLNPSDWKKALNIELGTRIKFTIHKGDGVPEMMNSKANGYFANLIE